MNNSQDEIRNLLKASRNMLSNSTINEEISKIKKQYGIITEQGLDLTSGDVTKKINVAKTIEDEIESDTDKESKDDKTQAYRISGGLIVLHGKEQTELELTTDEKIAFQETMDEFVTEVSDLVDFNKLNLYQNNVEWSGKIIDFDIDYFYSIGEENGVYINGNMIKTDDEFLDMVNKLKAYYEKFKSKWAKVLSSRKKTRKSE
jgi:hypothetical protein